MTDTTRPDAAGTQELRVVFDGPPSHESGRFVELETPDGCSTGAGEWHERPDGLWELRLFGPPAADVRRLALEEAARVAEDFRLKDHIAHDMKTGRWPQQSMPGEAIAAAIRALAGSPPSAPGYEPDGSSAPIDAAPQPPEAAEDVGALIERLRDNSWGKNVADTLELWCRDRERAADALAEAKEELEHATQDNHDWEMGALKDQELIVRLTAERDRLAEAVRALDEAVANSLNRDFAFWSGTSSRETVYPAWCDLHAALSSLSAPEQPAESSEAQ